jgi:hypothetical protein
MFARVRPPVFSLVVLPLAGFLLAPPAEAEVARALLREGDAFPEGGVSQIVGGLNNTATNHVGGYAVGFSSSGGDGTLSHIWGHALGGAGALLRTEGTFGPLVQTSFESFYGMADDGSLCYSASGTGGPVGGFDSVWKDDTPIAVEGDVYPHAANTWWRFGSRPGISGDGQPYFVGGLTDVQGGSTQNYGLFFGMAGNPLILGGDVLADVPAPVSMSSGISFDYRFSALASSYIAEIDTDLGTSLDAFMVLNGQGLKVGGVTVQEGTLVPVSAGGNGVENWQNFDFTGVAESGDWFFTGDTNAASLDEFIMKNGMIIYREGDMVDGQTLAGDIEGAYMNEDGDIGYIWDIGGGSIEALFLNERLILAEGDEVDYTGDGNVDVGAVVSQFTGISSLTIGDRDNTGRVQMYCIADVDTAGTVSTSDDFECFFCIEVDVEPTSVQLSNLQAGPSLRSRGVTISWTTGAEYNHEGFHVYRSRSINGEYARVNDELLVGSSPYVFTDSDVRANTTYYYKVGAVEFGGHEDLYGPIEVTTPQWMIRSVLAPARPNPFSANTDIHFTLSRDSQVRLEIFDVAGRLVRTLVDEPRELGEHSATWDGRTQNGATASAGVYFYRLHTSDVTQTRKIVRIDHD